MKQDIKRNRYFYKFLKNIQKSDGEKQGGVAGIIRPDIGGFH